MSNRDEADGLREAAQQLREATAVAPVEPVEAPEEPAPETELTLAAEVRLLRRAIKDATGALEGYRRRVRRIGYALAFALGIVAIVGAISIYSLVRSQDNLKTLVDTRGAERNAQISALATKVDINSQRTHDALCAALESPTITSQPDPVLHQLRDDLVCTPQFGDKK